MCALCDGQSIEDYVRDLEDTIDRHGWALQYVASAPPSSYEEFDGCGVDPAFCYTVGLTAVGHPEIVITGRGPAESSTVLNALGRRISVAGEVFEAGSRAWVAGFDLYFVDVMHSGEWLLMAENVYPPGAVRAVQAVWRDATGNLPWEGDVVSTIVQPVLGPPPGWYEGDI
ncbi:DUF4262 domain-containing protein [Rhodococcoides yunnanense]|uniref:DUF4262 domain-containing protein n=1 Tax=Rhodococcoides yunnanense TaxID=278209 RepID=UPI00093436F9|nr:DUF4262 domain-containing protein [Rhodococcus yunnanensis]